MIQKNIKKYSEFYIDEWWDTEIGVGIFQYYNYAKQRYSKEKMEDSFKNSNLAQDKIPYYKVNDAIYNLIICSSGTFTKGSNAPRDDNPIEEMSIEKSFLLGETEIPQEIYQAVLGTNPSNFKNEPKNPVERVSWYDAVLFCNKLSDLFGLDRYYTITKEGKIIDTIEPKQDYLVEINEDSKGFRLPTEWEWEYAAKAGTNFLYSGSNNADEVAWYEGNSDGTTKPIKGRKPNAWGFYDMSGNVWEWCENKYNSTSANRIRRGGSWNNDTSRLCSAKRVFGLPDGRNGLIGFRVCKYI